MTSETTSSLLLSRPEINVLYGCYLSSDVTVTEIKKLTPFQAKTLVSNVLKDKGSNSIIYRLPGKKVLQLPRETFEINIESEQNLSEIIHRCLKIKKDVLFSVHSPYSVIQSVRDIQPECFECVFRVLENTRHNLRHNVDPQYLMSRGEISQSVRWSKSNSNKYRIELGFIMTEYQDDVKHFITTRLFEELKKTPEARKNRLIQHCVSSLLEQIHNSYQLLIQNHIFCADVKSDNMVYSMENPPHVEIKLIDIDTEPNSNCEKEWCVKKIIPASHQPFLFEFKMVLFYSHLFRWVWDNLFLFNLRTTLSRVERILEQADPSLSSLKESLSTLQNSKYSLYTWVLISQIVEDKYQISAKIDELSLAYVKNFDTFFDHEKECYQYFLDTMVNHYLIDRINVKAKQYLLENGFTKDILTYGVEIRSSKINYSIILHIVKYYTINITEQNNKLSNLETRLSNLIEDIEGGFLASRCLFEWASEIEDAELQEDEPEISPSGGGARSHSSGHSISNNNKQSKSSKKFKLLKKRVLKKIKRYISKWKKELPNQSYPSPTQPVRNKIKNKIKKSKKLKLFKNRIRTIQTNTVYKNSHTHTVKTATQPENEKTGTSKKIKTSDEEEY